MSPANLTFADARASYEEAFFVIYGVPFDRTCSFRMGARFGPNAIREASYNFETYYPQYDVELTDVPIHDMGNSDEFGDVKDMVIEVEHVVGQLVRDGKFPIILGGEHSLSPAAVRAFQDVAVVSIDAHLDYRQEYLGKPDSHACSTRRIADHAGVRSIVPIGVRSVSREEHHRARDDGLFYVTSADVRENGIAWALDAALERLGDKKIYLTLDMDGIDPAYAPGVGTPEPFGLGDRDARECIQRLAPSLVGFDVVEVCPPCDNGNTSALAARLAGEVMAAVRKSRL